MNNNSNNMNIHEPVSSEAAEYVLGTLEAGRQADFVRSLETDRVLQGHVAFWQDRFQALASAIENVQPRAHVFAAIEATIEGRPQPGSLTIRADEGEWQQIFDGVHKKTLLIDHEEGVESFLLRMEAGASCPAHSHSKTEECLVLEGEIIIGAARFGVGDYHAAPSDIPHMPITTQIGALVYVRGELHG